MIAIIRIKGQIGVKKNIKETLLRLNLKRKYSCAILEKPTKVDLGMVNKVKDFVAFGDINEETLAKLKKARDKGKKYFALNPARGGIKTKLHFPKGVLGNNGEAINKLIERML